LVAGAGAVHDADMTEILIAPMTAVYAADILSWRYPAPYDCYNVADGDPGYYLDPANGMFAVLSGGELIGFRSFGPDGRVPGGAYDGSALDTGGGLRPALTGRGLGRSVIAAGLEFGRRRFTPEAFRVTVASFNTRALRVVTSLGFQPVSSFAATTDGRRFEILIRRCGSDLPLAVEQRGGVVVQDRRLLLVGEAEFGDSTGGGQRVIHRVVAAEHDAVDAHPAQHPH
jgi:RimJ/RimL family protein N-acetyltransferase